MSQQYPQFKEGTYYVPLQVSSSSVPETELLTQDPRPFIPPPTSPTPNSTYISVVPIVEINLRWYVEEMQIIYEWDNFIIEESRPKRTIQAKRRFELLVLAGELDL